MKIGIKKTNGSKATKERLKVYPDEVRPGDVVMVSYGDGEVKDVPHRCVRPPQVDWRSRVVTIATRRVGLAVSLRLPADQYVTVVR